MTTGDPGETDVIGFCGNGEVDEYESCDDGRLLINWINSGAK